MCGWGEGIRRSALYSSEERLWSAVLSTTNDFKKRSHWWGKHTPFISPQTFSSSLRSSRSRRRTVSPDKFVVTQRFCLILAIMLECGTSFSERQPHPPFLNCRMCTNQSLLGGERSGTIKVATDAFCSTGGSGFSWSSSRFPLWGSQPSRTGVVMGCHTMTFHTLSKGQIPRRHHMCNHQWHGWPC